MSDFGCRVEKHVVGGAAAAANAKANATSLEQHLLAFLTKKTKYSFSCSSFSNKRCFATNTVLFYVSTLVDQTVSVRTSVCLKNDIYGMQCADVTRLTGFTYYLEPLTTQRRCRRAARRLVRHAVRSLFRLYVNFVSRVRRFYLGTLCRGGGGGYDGRAFDALPRRERDELLKARVSLSALRGAKIMNSAEVLRRHAKLVSRNLDTAWELFCLNGVVTRAHDDVSCGGKELRDVLVIVEEEEEEAAASSPPPPVEDVIVVAEEEVVAAASAVASAPVMVVVEEEEEEEVVEEKRARRCRKRPRARRGGGKSSKPSVGDDDENVCFMCMDTEANVAFGCARHFGCQQCVRACWKVQQQARAGSNESFVSCPYCRHMGVPFLRSDKTQLTFPRYRLRMRPRVNYIDDDDDVSSSSSNE